MKWLVSKWLGVGTRGNSIFMLGMDELEWNSTWNVNVELVIKVGMRVLCMIIITLLIEYVWSVSVRKSLKFFR